MGCFMSKINVEPTNEKPLGTAAPMKSIEYQARLRTLNDSYKPPLGQNISSPSTSSPGGMKERRGSYIPLPILDFQHGAFQSKKFKIMLDKLSIDEDTEN
jgi:hypothetical protein